MSFSLCSTYLFALKAQFERSTLIPSPRKLEPHTNLLKELRLIRPPETSVEKKKVNGGGKREYPPEQPTQVLLSIHKGSIPRQVAYTPKLIALRRTSPMQNYKDAKL